MPVDWTGLAAVVLGMMMFLIPIAGLTARFALKPIAEAVAKIRASQGMNQELEMIDKRLSLLEQQQSRMEAEMERLGEVVEFHSQLQAPKE